MDHRMNEQSNAPPAMGMEDEPQTQDDYPVRVEGDALVIPSGYVMPQRCVKTNQPVSERDMVLTNVAWCPKSVGLSALLGFPALIFAYFVGRELCTITYGLTPRLRYRNVFFILVKVLACFAFLAAAIYMAVFDSTHWIIEPLMFLFFVLFLLSVVVLFMSKQPLYVTAYRDGLFWLKGFSKEYLEDLGL
jgi:hypothetical protein